MCPRPPLATSSPLAPHSGALALAHVLACACAASGNLASRQEYVRCEVSMIVMYSPRWSSSLPTRRDTAHDGCPSEFGDRRPDAGWDAGLCVYVDPLFRAPRGTPKSAKEECELAMREHSLRPASICETQFFIVGDFDDNPRQRTHWLFAAVMVTITCALWLIGLLHPRASMRLRGSFEAGVSRMRQESAEFALI